MSLRKHKMPLDRSVNELFVDGLVTSDLLLFKTVAFSTGDNMNINDEQKTICVSQAPGNRESERARDREKVKEN